MDSPSGVDDRLPPMLLHSAHSTAGPARPLTPKELRAVWASSGVTARGAPGREGEADAEEPAPRIDEGALEVRCGGAMVRIPLLLTEVRSGQDANTGDVAIAFQPRPTGIAPGSAPPGAWLAVLPGASAAACRRALDVLARHGAVRSDFAEAYALGASPIGRGGAAEVFLARPSGRPDAPVVVAKLPTPDAEEGGASDGVERELAMLVRAQGHPNVLRLHGLFRLGGSGAAWSIVSEYCAEGDLQSLVQGQALAEADARPIFKGVMQGLAHIHGRGIVHSDVKADNVLLRADREAVLADFGISRLAGEAPEASCQGRVRGTPGYVAPEVVAGKGATELSDVFGAGVVLFYMLSQRLPFSGADVMSTLRRTLRASLDFDKHECFRDASVDVKEFLTFLLRRKPVERPTAQDALLDPWLDEDAFHRTASDGDSLSDVLDGLPMMFANSSLPSMYGAASESSDIAPMYSAKSCTTASTHVPQAMRPNMSDSSKSDVSSARLLRASPKLSSVVAAALSTSEARSASGAPSGAPAVSSPESPAGRRDAPAPPAAPAAPPNGGAFKPQASWRGRRFEAFRSALGCAKG